MNIEVTSPIEQEVARIWKPFPKQEKFISLPFSIFEAMIGGAKGPGKTDVLVLLPLLYRFHENPNYKGIILRRTYEDLEREILTRQHKYYPSTGAVPNEQKHRWKWPNGAVHRWGSAEHENDIRRYDSDEYNLVEWDELTHFLEFQYQYLSFTRCRTSDPFLPAIVRSGTNPGNIGHDWVRRRFVLPCVTGFKRLRDPLTGLERIFIPATAYDNPALLENDPTYLLKLKMLPEHEYKAAMGDWFTFAGQVFQEWRIQPFINEPPEARHVIKSFPIPSWWPRIIAIDWGWDANTCIGWGAIAPSGRLYVYRIYNERNKYIPEWTRDLINLTGSDWDSVRRIKICHSAVQQRGEPKTIQTQVQEALDKEEININVELGKRDRIGGKMLVHEYLRWKKLDPRIIEEQFDSELADRLYRNRGPIAYQEYVDFFKQEEESILPKVQMFEETCKPLIDVIPSCVYEQKEGKVCEDVAEFRGDDPYDMLRMLLESAHEYVHESAKEFEERGKVDAVLQRYAQTGDATSLYRAMENLEQSNETFKSVRLYHRSRR